MSAFFKIDSTQQPTNPSAITSFPIEKSEQTALESSSERIQQTIPQMMMWDTRNRIREELRYPMIKDRAFPLQTPSVSDEVQQIGNPAERLLQRIFEEKVITEQARVEQGTVQAAPKPSTSHEKFTGTVYVFTKDEGGLRKPFCTGDKFQLHFRTNDEIGTLTLPAGTEKLMPGDNSELEVELLSPVAIKEGMRFAILKGDRTIGVGTISKIIK